jgi:hypothetical protein
MQVVPGWVGSNTMRRAPLSRMREMLPSAKDTNAKDEAMEEVLKAVPDCDAGAGD